MWPEAFLTASATAEAKTNSVIIALSYCWWPRLITLMTPGQRGAAGTRNRPFDELSGNHILDRLLSRVTDVPKHTGGVEHNCRMSLETKALC